MQTHVIRCAPAVLVLAVGLSAGLGEDKPVKLKPSRQTTHVLGPLKADGMVDYVRAYDEALMKGVTAENNAGPLLLKAMGSMMYGSLFSAGTSEHLEHAWKVLKIEGPVVSADETLITFGEAIKAAWAAGEEGAELSGRAKRITRQLPRGYAQEIRTKHRVEALFEQEMHKVPMPPTTGWTAQQYPLLEAWVNANEGPLDLLAQAAKKERLYLPTIVGENGNMLDRLRPGAGGLRGAVRALCARAMQRAGKADGLKAWDDVVTCLRLAELIGQEPAILPGLVAASLEAIAIDTATHMAAGGALTRRELRKCLDDLAALKVREPMERAMDLDERFMVLDAPGIFRAQITKRDLPEAARRIMDNVFDWELVLTELNKWCDARVAAMKGETYPQRVKARGEFSEKWLAHADAFRKRMKADIAEAQKQAGPDAPDQIVVLMYFGNRTAKVPPTEWRETFSKDLAAWMMGVFFPAAEAGLKTDALVRTKLDLLRVTLALALFRAEHRRFPVTLEDLAPDVLKEIPPDYFTQKPLIYRPLPGGFLLYSRGANGLDDGGAYEKGEEYNYADVAVRVEHGIVIDHR